MNISIPIIMLCLLLIFLMMLVKYVKRHKVANLEEQLDLIDMAIEHCNDNYRLKQLIKLRKKIRERIDNY